MEPFAACQHLFGGFLVVRNAVEQAVSGEPFRGESRYFWGDGSEHVVDFACMPIRDASGRVVVVIPTHGTNVRLASKSG